MTRLITHTCRGSDFLRATAVFPGLGRARAAKLGGCAARIPFAQGVPASRLHRLAGRQSFAVDQRVAARVAEIGRPAPALTPEARAVIERARIDARNWKDMP